MQPFFFFCQVPFVGNILSAGTNLQPLVDRPVIFNCDQLRNTMFVR